MIKGKMYASERVKNTRPHWAADKDYYIVYLVPQGEELNTVPLLFTYEQVELAAARAAHNPEDVPPPQLSWWQRLLEAVNGSDV